MAINPVIAINVENLVIILVVHLSKLGTASLVKTVVLLIKYFLFRFICINILRQL